MICRRALDHKITKTICHPWSVVLRMGTKVEQKTAGLVVMDSNTILCCEFEVENGYVDNGLSPNDGS